MLYIVFRNSVKGSTNKRMRLFTTSSSSSYESSLQNLLVTTRNTKVIYQGFTDKKAKAVEFGSNMVGGVSPTKAGTTHRELLVFGTVQQAVDETKPDIYVIYVPPPFAADAIIEAIEPEIGLIAAITEDISIHDMM
ncbi:ligase of succinyl-coa [Mucor circinelloides]